MKTICVSLDEDTLQILYHYSDVLGISKSLIVRSGIALISSMFLEKFAENPKILQCLHDLKDTRKIINKLGGFNDVY